MKKKLLLVYILNSHCIFEATESVIDLETNFLMQEISSNAGTTFRAPPPPSTLGTPLGTVQFQAYNGSTYSMGANVNGYYGIVGSGTPTANATMPGNIGMATVPSSGGSITARLLISALGRIGVGNFIPGTGTNNGLPNAILNVEGDNTASANSALHVGSRVTALTPLVTGTAYSTQVDGRCYDAGFSTFNTQFNVTNTFNIVEATFLDTTSFPLVINTPGIYVFAQNISTTATTAITINADDVIIDFNDYMLTGTGGAATGILLSNNIESTTIKNGTISGFSTTSISAPVNCRKITIDSMNIIGFQTALATSVSNTNASGWLINNCQFTNSTSAAAAIINAIGMNNCVFSDCVVSNCAFSGGATRIYSINDCSGLLFKNCIISNCTNSSFLLCFDYVLGGSASTGIVFDSCDVSNCTSTTSEFRAFRCAVNMSTMTCINCTASNNFGVATSHNFTQQISSLETSIFKNCISGGITATNLARGFYFGLGLGIAEDCIAFDATSNDVVAETSLGFHIEGSMTTLNRCIAFHQTAAASGANQAIGIKVDASLPTQQDSLVTGCVAFGQETGIFVGTLNTINQFFENISTKNTNNYFNFPAGSTQTAAGIAGINGSLTIPLVNVSVT